MKWETDLVSDVKVRVLIQFAELRDCELGLKDNSSYVTYRYASPDCVSEK